MAVQGYNVDPESDDPVIGIELEEDKQHAVIYIDEGALQSEVHLDWYELCTFIAQARRIRLEMEWNRARYAFASTGLAGDTQHLVEIGNTPIEKSTFVIEPKGCKFKKTLCGRPAPVWESSDDPRGWDINPVLSNDPCVDKVCKNCYRKWQKLQQA